MKTILLSSCIIACSVCAMAQSPDTTKIGEKTIRSAWSQRPDTAFGKQQNPVSSQPSNSPVPPPLTNPIDNPTSGQTNPPEQTPPVDIPPPIQRRDTLLKRKPIKTITPKPKRSDYDTLPGTNRKG